MWSHEELMVCRKIKMKNSAFAYQSGNSILHKCPSWIKILFIPLINILIFSLPFYFALAFLFLQFVLACVAKISFKAQLSDLKPVIFYAFMLLWMQLILGLTQSGVENLFIHFTWQNQKENVFMLVKLFCIMQTASLLFRTTTALKIRDGIAVIEKRTRKILHVKKGYAFTNTISLFLNFIPLVSQIWQQSVKAWRARGGKKSIKMYCVLLPVLFSVGMKKAYNSARALYIRQS